MNLHRRLPGSLRPLGGLALAAALALPAGALAEQLRNHFDSDALVRAPGFFDLVVLGEQSKARWLVLADKNPPSQPNRLSQTEKQMPAGSIAAALRRNAFFQDATASTFLRQGEGPSGMVLRMAGEKDFLLVLVDTKSGDVTLSSERDGKVAEIGRGKATFASTWEKLSVRLAGPDVAVSFGGKPIFDAKDPQPKAGRAGLATAGPGGGSFDEFDLDFVPSR